MYLNNNIYIATNNGINILSTFGNILLSIDILNYFNNYNIYDFSFNQNKFIISSELGLFEYIYDLNKIEQITEKKYLKAFINQDNDFILSKRNKIFKVTPESRELLISLDRIKDLCLCNNYLWINNINKSILFNLNNNKSFTYYKSDGIVGNIINHIGCDDSWVWFSTDKGISMYNWSKYHNNEK